MSTIDEFMKTQFDLSRMIAVEGAETDAEQVIASGLGFLQPVQDKSQLLNEADWGKEHWLFIKKNLSVLAAFRSVIGNTTNPVENDTVTIDSVKYGVNGVSEYSDPFEGTDAHLKIVVTRRTSSNYQ
jgi:hypothetical protein